MVMSILKQKFLWIGLTVVIILAAVLTIAFLGSSVNAQLKNAPIALVMLDEGTTLQSGAQLNLGQTLADTVTASSDSQSSEAFKWTILTDKDEAMEAMNNQEYYGIMVIPEDFSSYVMSFTGENQTPGEVEVYINGGMSTTVANILTQAIGKMETSINENFKTQLTAQLTSAAQQTASDSTDPAAAAQSQAKVAAMQQAQAQIIQNLQQSTLVSFTSSNVNAVPDHSANGNAPVSVTMLAWMIGFISSILLFFVIKKVVPTKKSEKALALGIQVVCGIVFCFIASLFILLVAHGLFGMTIPNNLEFCLYFTLVCFCFFLMQSMLVNWFGVGGIALVLLVFFFGLPILSLPYEMLSSATKFWLYSWIPLRFGVDLMRDFFYFANTNIIVPIRILLSAGGICMVISFLSLYKPVKKIKMADTEI